MMMKRLYSEERGQSLVIVALAMVGLIAFLALVIDGGMAFAARRQMQNAADSASLAGAHMLQFRIYTDDTCGDAENAILEAVNTYAERNGVQDPSTNVQSFFIYVDENGQIVQIEAIDGTGCVPDDAEGVRVRTETTFDSYFARVVGRDSLGAAARASVLATGGNPGAAFEGFFPLAVNCDYDGDDDDDDCGDDFTLGETYRIFDTDDKEAPGSFGWLDLNGSQNFPHEMACWIAPTSYPACAQILVEGEVPGDWDTSPGVTNALKDEVNNRLGDLVVIPFYDYTNGETGSNLDYHLIKLAVMRIHEYWFAVNFHSDGAEDPGGGQKYIDAEFVKWYTSVVPVE